MSIQIHSFDKDKFPFDDVTLANPQGLQGGAFFSRLKLLGDSISVQTPKCKTKNGIVKTEKKIYCDLMFSKDDDAVIEFLENIEDKIKNLIYEKKDKWFHSDMDMDTIDYHWQNILRSYKGRHILLRCFIRRPKTRLNSEPTVQIYDEDENLLTLTDITKNKTIMALLEITGLKFTSQSFSLEFNLTQAMVLKEKVFKNKCLIKQVADNVSTEKITSQLSVATNDTSGEIENTSEIVSNTTKNENTNDNTEDVDTADAVTDITVAVEDANDSTEDVVADTTVALEDTNESTDDVVTDATVAVEDANKSDEDVVVDAATDVKDTNESTEVAVADEGNVENEKIDNKTFKSDVVKNYSNDLIVQNVETVEDKKSGSLAKSDPSKNINNAKSMVHIETLEKNDELNEINLVMPADKEVVKLKKPNEVYMEIYKEVKKRAKEAKRKAIEAYLEAKRIKSLYLLDDIESSDDENELLEMTDR